MLDLSGLADELKNVEPAARKLVVRPGTYTCSGASVSLRDRKDGAELRAKFKVEDGEYAGQVLTRYITISKKELSDEFKKVLVREFADLKINIAKMSIGESYPLTGRFTVVWVSTAKFPIGHVHSFNPLT